MESKLKPELSFGGGEHWVASAGAASIAKLDIPADLHRERCFEISVAMTVRAHAQASLPWHECRFAPTAICCGSGARKLSIRAVRWPRLSFPAPLEPGRALRLMAVSECGEGQRLTLVIDAEEC